LPNIYHLYREFRQVGSALRNHVHLRNIPILALTATAVPRVQQDICTSLQLRNPFVSKQSLDRANLKIRVVKRSGVASAMKELLAVLNAPSVRGSKESTIVYASTRSQVEELALYLNSNLQTNQSSAVRIDAYHAGLSQGERNDAHTRFLTGATTVIVATVAFGMGIDKPDTRRVIHYGCSKTLEEYYQQIGRAGRDGLPAECIMYVSEVDFDRYKSEFYMGGLKGYARHATETSMAALRSYCLTSDVCRRKALLTYFQETPAFGERCGNCDVCLSAAKYGSDSQRDFGPLGAQVLLQAIDSLADQGLSQIVKVVSGSTVENHRYKPGMIASSVRQRIEAAKEKLVKKYTQEYYRDLISPLTQKGYLIASSKTANPDGFSRTWTVYNVSEKGRLALMETQPIVLPVTDSVRQMEQQEEEKRQKVLEQLERNGIQLDKLPQNEVETGDGVVIRAYTKWYAYVENAKKAEKDERVAQLEALVGLIETWRSDTAGKQRIAPASVLAEHLLYAIAYTAATMQQGGKLSADALEAVGVRSREIGALVHRLGAWVDEVQPARSSSTSGVSTMILLETSESKGWQHAVYKPQKKTGMMTWEQSYVRFVKGESPQAIAMTQASGRPIQANTVVGHLLDAITYGRKVDLRRLVEFVPAPTQDEWDQLRNAEISTGIDVTGNPDTSGLNGDKFLMKDFLRPIVGDRLAELPFTERSESERQEFTAWCDRLKWYMVLRRVGFEPSFSVPE
jgi:RecQ family ATP-dependent DNA helicase